MEFEWDELKNSTNIKKHKISFAEAREVFKNPLLTFIDARFNYGEIRKVAYGKLTDRSIGVVVYTIRNDKYRIISARKAKAKERKLYYEYFKKRAREIDAIKDEEIDTSDIPEFGKEFWAKAKLELPENKKAISLRVDTDVLNWFKKMGKGYQSRMNVVLKTYMNAHKS